MALADWLLSLMLLAPEEQDALMLGWRDLDVPERPQPSPVADPLQPTTSV